MSGPSIFHLSDDLLLKILFKVDGDGDGDPRHWPRLASVCTRLSALVRSACYPHKCRRSIPAAVANLLPADPPPPPRWWSLLHKIAVCCPGLLHAGVLLDHSDFGLERDIGQDHSFPLPAPPPPPPSAGASSSSSSSWSLLDDLFPDGLYDHYESAIPATTAAAAGGNESKKRHRRPAHGPAGAHPARGAWNLSREEGNKLLASRFRGDALYICGWPGCVHGEEKRKYMVFRGVFKNFERSGVWRAIKDGNRGKLRLGCAFCDSGETYDLLSAFCLRRMFGCYHDDGEPVVRAYVCENGHVSGAWTDRPMYT